MKKEKPTAKVFIISGPSGAGEDSVIEGLKKIINFNRVITTVTRKKRTGESEKHPYYFITVDKFKKLIKEQALLEWAIVYGDYRGCTKQEISRLLKLKRPILWKVDWQGVKTIKKALPEAVSIFVAPASYQSLEKRLIARGTDSVATIKERKAETIEWLKHKSVYDYVIINADGKLKQTIQKVAKIIKNRL